MRLYTLLSFLILSGCAGVYSQQAYNQMNQSTQTEMAAWDKVQGLYDSQCPHSTPQKPLPRERAIESAECYERYARQHVIPVAFDPLAVNDLLANYKRTAVDLKKGRIDRDEAKLETQENWNDYLQEISIKADRIQSQAYQRDLQAAQQRQQALQNLNQQIQQQNNSMKTTNCHFVGNMMQCTEL